MANGTTQEWETDWRKTVNGKLDELLSEVKSLASRMAVNEQSVKDLRDKPGNARDWGVLWVALAALGVSMVCGGAQILVYSISLIVTHWH